VLPVFTGAMPNGRLRCAALHASRATLLRDPEATVELPSEPEHSIVTSHGQGESRACRKPSLVSPSVFEPWHF
jgi:hypothetical protein